MEAIEKAKAAEKNLAKQTREKLQELISAVADGKFTGDLVAAAHEQGLTIAALEAKVKHEQRLRDRKATIERGEKAEVELAKLRSDAATLEAEINKAVAGHRNARLELNAKIAEQDRAISDAWHARRELGQLTK